MKPLCTHSRQDPGSLGRQRGFTLVEILLSLAIGGFILFSASSFLFSLQTIWTNHQEGRAFKKHMDGVTYFLQYMLTNSARTGTERSSVFAARNNRDMDQAVPQQAMVARTSDLLSWVEPEWQASYDQPLLYTSLSNAPAYFFERNQKEGGALAVYWNFEDTGLKLHWHRPNDTIEDEDDLQTATLSPFLQETQLYYYDKEEDSWRVETTPLEDENNTEEYLLPAIIKIVFTYDEESYQRFLYLPAVSKNYLLP